MTDSFARTMNLKFYAVEPILKPEKDRKDFKRLVILPEGQSYDLAQAIDFSSMVCIHSALSKHSNLPSNAKTVNSKN